MSPQPLLGSEYSAERAQLRAQRFIDEMVTDLDPGAADELPVNGEGRTQLLAARAFELADQVLTLLVVQVHRRRDARPGNAFPLVHHVPEGAGNLRDERDPIAFEQQHQE